MNVPVTRPLFAEGQILAAADLDRLAKYPRGRSERHNRFVHRWGIVTGLTLEPDPTEDADGNPFARIFLEPGLAVDGEGREVLVTERVLLNHSRFRLTIGNNIDPEQSYPVFLVSQYKPIAGAAGPTDPCGGDAARGSIGEGHDLRFGRPGDETADQIPSPLSGEPTGDEGSGDWQILVGFVTWTNDAKNFAGIDAPAATAHRPFIGINAGVIAGDGELVQVQPKGDLLPGHTVLQVRQTDKTGAELCFGTFKAPGAEIEPLFTVNAAGDVTAKGVLKGKRTGNTVQVQSGLASDGIIVPLPPGITDDQLTDGSATVHIEVAPMIDPAHSPDPAVDYAALVQECRIDADRRVHCRIAWASLPLGAAMGGAVGDALVSGPGAVSYLIAVATSEGDGS